MQVVAATHGQAAHARGGERGPQVLGLGGARRRLRGRRRLRRERRRLDVDHRDLQTPRPQPGERLHELGVERQDDEGHGARAPPLGRTGQQGPQRRPETHGRVGRDPGETLQQTGAPVGARREPGPSPVVLRQAKADTAPRAQGEVGDRAGGLYGELEVGLRGLPGDERGRPVEQHRHVTARRVVRLAQHEGARLGRRLPVDVTERLTGVVRPHAAKLRPPERRQPVHRALATCSHAGERARTTAGTTSRG